MSKTNTKISGSLTLAEANIYTAKEVLSLAAADVLTPMLVENSLAVEGCTR